MPLPISPQQFDGRTPAASVTSLDVSRPVVPPVTGDFRHSSAQLLTQVLNQFAVGHNPRYRPRDTSGTGVVSTHCDAFASDVALAMGAVLPVWQDAHGLPTTPGRGSELNANGIDAWLRVRGAGYGWSRVEAGPMAAARLAAAGCLVLATWANPKGPGHVAVVRPEGVAVGTGQCLIAQAGATCFNMGTLAQGFGARTPSFWACGAAPRRPAAQGTRLT